jgi:hypothetical protein
MLPQLHSHHFESLSWFTCGGSHYTLQIRFLVRAFQRAGPARVRRLPARMKLKKGLIFVHVLCMYLSSKHAEMHSNTLLLPFY